MAASDISFHLEQIRKRKWDDRSLAQKALQLAAELQTGALRYLSASERTLLSALSRLAADNRNRRFIRSLCSQVFHCSDPQSRAEQLRRLISDFNGIPNLFSTMGKIRLKGAAIAPRSLQAAAMAEVRRVFQSTFGELTLPQEADRVGKKVREMGKAGIAAVIAPLAPDVFGEKSAERYVRNLEAVLSKQQEAGVVIDPRRLCPSLSAYSPEQGAALLAEKISALVELASRGSAPRRLLLECGLSDVAAIVSDAFRRVMESCGEKASGLILELPGYLSSSESLLRELITWASARCAKGAAPVRLALIKGASLMEEQQLNHLYGSRAPLSRSKLETDRRFKRLLRVAMAESKGALLPMIGTHSCFDLAYGLLLWASSGKKGMPGILLTEGLGNHQARLLARQGADVTLRCLATAAGGEAEFEHYLITLLNELALPDGFLSGGYAVETTSMEWNSMRQHFLASVDRVDESARKRPESEGFESCGLGRMLERSHIDALYHEAHKAHESSPSSLELRLAGRPYESRLTCIHRSLTVPGLAEYRFPVADYEALHEVLRRAGEAQRQKSEEQDLRRRTLLRLARSLEEAGEELAGLMASDAGYTLRDADVELCNAVNACRFCARELAADGFPDGTRPSPLGVAVVAPSPNHPVEEAVSGVAAAWAAGNAVIYRPPLACMRLSLRLHELMQAAGMKEPSLQLLACLDNEMTDQLMADARVKLVVASLSEARCRRLAENNPDCRLAAPSCGAGVVYLDAPCDWRQAVRDLAAALRRRSGRAQGCPHLVLIHESLGDNHHFLHALSDALSSCKAAPGWVEGSGVGPMPEPLTDEERRLLQGVEGDGEWLVQPFPAELGSQLWSPGLRLGVKADGPYATGASRLPLLSLLKVSGVDEAISLQNRRCRGGVAIIYTLNDEVRKRWRKAVAASHQGINCCPAPQPGIIPGGSRGDVCFAPNPCGSNLPAVFCRWEEVARPQRRGKQRDVPFSPWEQLQPKPDPEDFTRLTAAADSISYWWTEEFGKRHLLDPKPGETTELSYRPVSVCLRVEESCSNADLGIALMAALRAGCETHLSCATMRPWMQRELAPLGVSICEESRSDYQERFTDFARRGVRVRDWDATPETLRAAAACGLEIDTAPVVSNGRLEMLHGLRELVVTRRTARYGNLHDDDGSAG